MAEQHIAFDTLAVTKRLQASGLPKKHAEAIAHEQANLLNNNLVTQYDIKIVQKDIEQLRSDTKKDFKIIRKEIVISRYITIGSVLAILLSIYYFLDSTSKLAS